MEETGVPRGLLEELFLKALLFERNLSLVEVGSRLGLSLAVIEELFQQLRASHLLEVTGMAIGGHRVTLTSAGRGRAQELFQRNAYVGAAPVNLRDYVRRVRRQAVARVRAPDVRRALSPLVLSDELIKQVGVAIISGAATVLHGPTGTGKTAIAELIGEALHDDEIWIPHAVEVDGQIIAVLDPMLHAPVEHAPATDGVLAAERDNRWLLCHRPSVITGGELTLDLLELQSNAGTGFLTAPLQMQANNGILVIDDFGRQRFTPDELLNRWIVALDRRVDYLTLPGGRKFDIPFELLVVFSTNVEPRTASRFPGRQSLQDEAFLRRIPNKIPLTFCSDEHFAEIFRRVCEAEEVECDPDLVRKLATHIQQTLGEPLRQCYPRDLVRQVLWEAQYDERDPEFTWEALERACASYFLGSSTRTADPVGPGAAA